MSASEVRAGHAGKDGMLPAGERRGLYLYLLPFVLVPCLLMLAAFLIVPTPWFTEHSGSSYLANIGYAAKLHDMRCDVLVYGDSSAMVAIDPAILRARTGLSACNIAEFEGVTLMNGTELVDTFLRNNPRPRVILFLYAPEDLAIPQRWPGISMFEAISFNLEYERNLRTAAMLLRHPDETFAWAELGMRRAIQRARSPVMSAEVVHERENGRGIFPSEPSTANACAPSFHAVAPDLAWVASLRSRYGVDGTRVLVDATPTAPCDPGLGFYRDHVNGVVDNTPYPTIPLKNFQVDGRLHTNAEGTKVVSAMIAAQINASLGSVEPPHVASAREGGR